MTTVVERSVLVDCSAAQMRALVENIEAYPQFLPWCSAATIVSSEGGKVVATLSISYKGIKQQVTTENTHETVDGREAIHIRLVSGPFKSLDGLWNFLPLEETACKVSLQLRYEFASRLMETVVGPVFRYIADTMVEAFVQRANVVNKPK